MKIFDTKLFMFKQESYGMGVRWGIRECHGDHLWSEYIELKLALSQALSERRKQSNLTQVQLAKMLKSSQSRIAKMEKGDPTVTIDLLVKSLLAMGATKESIAKVIS